MIVMDKFKICLLVLTQNKTQNNKVLFPSCLLLEISVFSFYVMVMEAFTWKQPSEKNVNVRLNEVFPYYFRTHFSGKFKARNYKEEKIHEKYF